MKTFDQYCETVLDESRKSMSRMLKHIIEDPFVIIISCERSPYEIGMNVHSKLDLNDSHNLKKVLGTGKLINAERTDSFRNTLKLHRYGYIPVEGSYYETRKIGDQQLKVRVIEKSTIVYCNADNQKDILQICLSHAKLSNQECILYVEKGKGYYLYPGLKKKEYVGVFYPERLGDYYTVLVQKNDKTHRQEKSFTFTTNKNKLSTTLKRLFDIKDE